MDKIANIAFKFYKKNKTKTKFSHTIKILAKVKTSIHILKMMPTNSCLKISSTLNMYKL